MSTKKTRKTTGRPSKYKPEMCDQVIELMKEGASLVEVAAELGICKDTVHEWKKTNDEFSDSIKRGVQLSAAWWERKGRTSLENRDFSATLWYMNMKNRFGWKDKQENQHTGKDGGPIQHEVGMRPPLTREEWERKHGLDTTGRTPASGD